MMQDRARLSGFVLFLLICQNLVSVKKVELNLCQIYEDRFLLEEGVCRWHMTEEKRNIDHKDIQIVQVIF